MGTTKLLPFLRSCVASKSITKGNLTSRKSLIGFYFLRHLHESASEVEANEYALGISFWNGRLAAYTRNSMFMEALHVFEQLWRNPDLKPDSFTYPSVLKACGGLGRVKVGSLIHTHLIKTGFLCDVVVASSVVGMYAKCCLFGDATKLFDEMPERDVATWNTVISGYYHDGQPEKALELFEKMKSSGFEPSSVALTIAISSCARLLDLERGREIHREHVKGEILLAGFVGSALVDLYGRCGVLEAAKEVFEQIPKSNVAAWNSMIAGYSSIGDCNACMELFRRMHLEGVKPTTTTFSSILLGCSRSTQLRLGKFIHCYMLRHSVETNIYVSSSLVDLYFKCKDVKFAENVFRMLSKSNVVSWNVMISRCVAIGNYFDALGMYERMIEGGVRPDAITFTSVLSACSQLTALEKGMEIHNCIIESKLETDHIVMGALLDMYAKCGAVEEALHIFSELPVRDVVSWTSMITAYAFYGKTHAALDLFGQMKLSNIRPDGIICSHAGLVDEGYRYFNQMVIDYCIKPQPEHYSCLIDLLGRMGRLHEAHEFLQRTSENMEHVEVLSTLLSACYLHNCLEVGEEIAQLLIQKDTNDPSTYIALANIYASSKKWEEARKVRLKIEELGLKKNPGCSWIEIDKKIQQFFVGDKSFLHAETVYDCLTSVAAQMDKDGLLLESELRICYSTM